MIRSLITNITYTTLHSIVRYRRAMVDQNLEAVFSKDEEWDLKLVRKRYYKVLARYICESFLDPYLSRERQLSKVQFVNPDTIEVSSEEGTQAIVMSSHYGNWELITPQMPIYIKRSVVGVYKPLSSKYVDRYILKKRGRFGLKLKAMQQVLKSMIQDEADVYVFINDQSPARGAGGRWIDFLGRPTLWFNGVDKLRSRFDFDFYYQQVIPHDDYYEVKYIKIDGEDPLLTYVRLLEEDVRKFPEYWLWSHNRWKNQPSN